MKPAVAANDFPDKEKLCAALADNRQHDINDLDKEGAFWARLERVEKICRDALPWIPFSNEKHLRRARLVYIWSGRFIQVIRSLDRPRASVGEMENALDTFVDDAIAAIMEVLP